MVLAPLGATVVPLFKLPPSFRVLPSPEGTLALPLLVGLGAGEVDESLLPGSNILSKAASVFLETSLSTLFSTVRSTALSARLPNFFKICDCREPEKKNSNRKAGITLGNILKGFIIFNFNVRAVFCLNQL